MDEFILTVITQLGVAGIFLVLYLRLWTDYKDLQKRYIDQIEGQLRNEDIDKSGAKRQDVLVDLQE